MKGSLNDLSLAELKELQKTASSIIERREKGAEADPEPDKLDLQTFISKVDPAKFDRSMLDNLKVEASSKVQLFDELKNAGLSENDSLFQKIYSDEKFKVLPLR